MTFEKEKREVRGTPSSTSLSIYRLCVLSSLFLVSRYFSYLFRDFRVVDTSGEFFGTGSYGKHRNIAVGMSSALPSYHSFPSHELPCCRGNDVFAFIQCLRVFGHSFTEILVCFFELLRFPFIQWYLRPKSEVVL